MGQHTVHTLSFTIDGAHGVLQGSKQELIESLLKTLTGQLPTLDPQWGLGEPKTEDRLRMLIGEAGLQDRVTFTLTPLIAA